MKKLIITIAAALSLGLVSMSAAEKEQKAEPKNHFKQLEEEREKEEK